MLNTATHEINKIINNYFTVLDGDCYEPVHHQHLDEVSDYIYRIECLRKVTTLQYS